MRNILFVIGTYPSYGGTEKVTTVLANAFVSKGHSVSIVSFEQPNPELQEEELDPSVQLFALSTPLRKKLNVSLLEEIIINRDIDVIINQWCLPYYVTLLINRARKKKNCILISTLHGVPDQNKRLLKILHYKNNSNNLISRLFYKTLHASMLYLTGLNLKYVYMQSDLYVVLSKSFIEIFLKLSKIKNKNKIISIANPITIKAPLRFDKNYQDSKENEIVFVGRMDYVNKRVHRVVEAWEELHKKYPHWKLVLVGDGPEKQKLESYVKIKNIERVIFEGFKKEAPIEFYKRAKILLLTSDLEGFGLVVIEGMIYGVVPIVYGSYSAIYDIIENGKSGFITTTPYSKDKTLEYLNKLMLNDQLYQTISEEAYNKAQNFALDRIIMEWESVFERVYKKKYIA
ncbi:glycosyltransferase [Confluentibacter sediminis]|uniref:glycosyltransferase n=1 Tax=Confluentibacter sediminis TaxID=2219045 RepID=UPI000DACBBD6|nr:glycosyltransferase [Confluentibacter sediminis]